MNVSLEMALAQAWLVQKRSEAGAQGLVVGLSGGIDSAVVLALAVRAGGGAVTAVIMPCHSDPRDEEDARLAAFACGVTPLRIDLAPVYDALVASLPDLGDLARANIKPRLRMTTLYAVAQTRQSLVVGTGNRTELELGYFTKYGDGGVDLLPLGGYLKREVRELARALGVPQAIIDKPPSAGLWSGQTDEGEMGMRYEDVDRVLAGEDGASGITGRVQTMSSRAAHKRALAPIFPRP